MALILMESNLELLSKMKCFIIYIYGFKIKVILRQAYVIYYITIKLPFQKEEVL